MKKSKDRSAPSGVAWILFKISASCLFLLIILGIFCLPLSAGDSPHNTASGVSCASCHGTALADSVDSPFWNPGARDVTGYNRVCTGCHDEPVTGGPYGNLTGPFAATHAPGGSALQCTTCHNNHDQDQIIPGKNNKPEFFIATATGQGVAAGDEPGTTKIFYSGWSGIGDWSSPENVAKKTGELSRGAQLVSDRNSRKRWSIYMILDVVTGAAPYIVIKGNVASAPNIGIFYGQLINRTIVTNSGSREVRFWDKTGSNAFVNAGGGGICQVCHNETGHWSDVAPNGDKHFAALSCTECHPHNQGLKAVPPDHDSLVTVPSFCKECHVDSILGVHNSSETGWVKCDSCHDTNNNYALTGFLPLYLDPRTTWDAVREKDMLTGNQARCDECHQGQYQEHVTDTGHGKLHEKIILGYDSDNNGAADQVLACDACHYPDAVQEHVTRRKIECSACHQSSSAKVLSAIAKGRSAVDGGLNQVVYCDACHNTDPGMPAGNLIANHHQTSYSQAGNCTKCHVVGPGERGPKRPPCWYCHATGKPGDPQRVGTDKHDQGPAITETGVKDYRVCFSCHLAGSQGNVSGVPLVTPMHGLPGTPPNHTNLYWPYGYYKDGANQWQASVPLMPNAADPFIPANLEGDPVRWWVYPGWHTLNYLGETKMRPSSIYNDWTHPEVQNWASSGPNTIRNLVNIGFQRQDYPTVLISMGGNFEVPSFDGTGTIGKPTGSGSLSVTLSAKDSGGNGLPLPAGARWRLDGGLWQNSGATLGAVTDRDNHLVEFRPLPGWAEPPPLPVSVVNGQLTVLNGAAVTYGTCPDDFRLQVVRTGGDPALTFAWTRPEQEEIFQVATGLQAGAVECELWRESGTELVEAEGFAATTAAGGDTCRLFKTGTTPAGDYDLVLRVTCSSCFRNSIELPLAVTVTAQGAPSPVGQAGGMIQETSKPSLALPAAAYQDFLHLAGNLYVQLGVSGTISTFTIDNAGTISPVIATADLWGNALYTKMVRVSDTLIAVTYRIQNSIISSIYESHLMTVGIEQDGAVITTKQDYPFHVVNAHSLRPQIFPHQNSNLFIVTWFGSDFTGLLTVHIDQSGVITELDRDLTLPQKGVNWEGNILHVAGDKYAFAMPQDIYIFEVNDSGAITIPLIPGSTYRYAADNYYVEIIRVKGDIFAVAYSKGSSGIDAGVLETISISDSGVISPTINTYLFEPCSAVNPQLIAVSDNVIGVYYHQYSSCDGQSGVNLKTIEITDDGRIMVPPLGGLELAGGSYSDTRKLLPVGGDIFAFSLFDDRSKGASFSGVRTYKISSDNDSDGIMDSVDNCTVDTNRSQSDNDGDGIGNACDNCPDLAGANQNDADSDLIGDICDTCPNDPDNDEDNDTVCAGAGYLAPKTRGNDNCPATANKNQTDSDGDGIGDACDVCANDADNDRDGDGICFGIAFSGSKTGGNDNCAGVANAGQVNSDTDTLGDACDNCPTDFNQDQADSDCDGAGNACSTPVYFKPTDSSIIPSQFIADGTLAWNDLYGGENGYMVERKTEACSGSSQNFAPLAKFFRHDDFSSGIDPAAWTQTAQVQTASTTTPPAGVSDASGSAGVSVVDGKVRLHTISHESLDTGMNNTRLAFASTALVGSGDFDLQFDYSLPSGTIAAAKYVIYARIWLRLPDTNGKRNEVYIERNNSTYLASISVENPTPQTNSTNTTDSSGKLRIVRSNRYLACYYWDGTSWQKLLEHSAPLTDDLVPKWGGVFQYASRNETGGQDVTTDLDNFRLQVSGNIPAPVLSLAMDESLWQGNGGEVIDLSPGNSHGTAMGGAITVDDNERGRVGYFDGIDDYVDVPGNGSLENMTDGSYTFAAWAKPENVPPCADQVTYHDCLYTVISRPYPPASINYDGNQNFVFYFYNNAWARTDALDSGVYTPGVWHHLVGVVDNASNTVTLYVDGQAKDTQPFIDPVFEYGTSSYKIGASNPGGGFRFHHKGNIDDTRFYKRALTADEVTALYKNSMQLAFSDYSLSAGTDYCYRVYPFKNDSCPNWTNHATEFDYSTASNSVPDTPINTTPANGVTNVYSLTPGLTSSPFNDGDGTDTHQASRWQISTNSGASFGANIIYDSQPGAAVNTHSVTAILTANTTYYWRVQYRDSKGEWSAYSAETSFVISNTPPVTPTNSNPTNGATDMVLRPTLVASTFSDSDGGDTFLASQWQVSTAGSAGFAAAIVYDSGTAAAVNTHTVPSSRNNNSIYYWRVRYQDSRNVWSAWSGDTFFTTSKKVSLFHFEEGSGTAAADSFGPNNGTIIGSTWTGAGGAYVGSNALGFNGTSSDRMNWTYNDGWTPKNNFAIEAMVKAAIDHQVDTQTSSGASGTAGQNYLFYANPASTSMDANVCVSMGSNGISVYEHTGGYMPSIAVYSGAIGTGWNHVVVTYTNRQSKIYVNGALVRTGLTSPKLNVYPPYQLGGGYWGHFQGSVDEVVIYGTTLTDAEVLARCQAVGKCP